MTIEDLHEFEAHLSIAAQAVLADARIGVLLEGYQTNHPGDYVGIKFTIPPAGGLVTDLYGVSWYLRYNGCRMDVEISQRRRATSQAQLDRVHEHFYKIAARVRLAFAAHRIEEPKSIFTVGQLPSVEVEGEELPIYNIGGLAPVGSDLSWNEDFREDLMTVNFEFNFQVDPRVLNAVQS